MPRPLHELIRIDWSAFDHCYGPATDAPEQIANLTSGDEDAAEDAWAWLWGSLSHQGSVYPATAAALPFLVGLADEGLERRQSELLDYLGFVGSAAWSTASEVGDAAVRDALAAERATFLRWLVHRSRARKQVAIHLLACCGDESSEAVDALWTLQGRTRSAALIELLLLALRWLAHRSKHEPMAARTQQLAALLPEPAAALFLRDLGEHGEQLEQRIDLSLLQRAIEPEAAYIDRDLYRIAEQVPSPRTLAWAEPPFTRLKVVFSGPSLMLLEDEDKQRTTIRLAAPGIEAGSRVDVRTWRERGPWTVVLGSRAVLVDASGAIIAERQL